MQNASLALIMKIIGYLIGLPLLFEVQPMHVHNGPSESLRHGYVRLLPGGRLQLDGVGGADTVAGAVPAGYETAYAVVTLP